MSSSRSITNGRRSSTSAPATTSIRLLKAVIAAITFRAARFADPMRFLIDEENPYFKLGAATADIDLHRLLRELTLSANRANASIYTIDPRGLAGVVDAGQYIDQSEWRTYLQKTTSTFALHVRSHRWLCGGQHQRFRRRAQAHRRRDQRLLRARVSTRATSIRRSGRAHWT